MTATRPTVKYYFAGEHTTTWSKATGLCPLRECSHKHRTEEGADKCAGIHGAWVSYAKLSNGVVTRASLHHMLTDDV
jgi:hypothetical protein